jgi:hypothetical protein
MPEPELKSIVVTIDDEHLPTIQTVAAALRLAGMNVEQVMSTVGIITGKAPATALADLKSIAGVVAVESDEPMQAL